MFLIQCKKGEFTCDNGGCLDLKQRCNNLFECSDGSDEDNCEPLWIDKDNYRKTFPPVSGKEKTEITVGAEINAVTNIDEMAMTFRGDIKLSLKWRDSRIKLRDLEADGTFLNKHWMDQIWLPPLILSNTVGNMPILSDESLVVKILKKGESVHNLITDLHEGTLFLGIENDLQLDGQYETTFKCLFELHRFPFDNQKCTMNLKIPYDIRNYTKLKPNDLHFSGKYFYSYSPMYTWGY